MCFRKRMGTTLELHRHSPGPSVVLSPIVNFIPWNTSLSILRAASPVEHSLNKPAHIIMPHLSPRHRCVCNSWFCAQVWPPCGPWYPMSTSALPLVSAAANEGGSMPAQRSKYSAQGSIINCESKRENKIQGSKLPVSFGNHRIHFTFRKRDHKFSNSLIFQNAWKPLQKTLMKRTLVSFQLLPAAACFFSSTVNPHFRLLQCLTPLLPARWLHANFTCPGDTASFAFLSNDPASLSQHKLKMRDGIFFNTFRRNLFGYVLFYRLFPFCLL